jgi:hypothetical protein
MGQGAGTIDCPKFFNSIGLQSAPRPERIGYSILCRFPKDALSVINLFLI